MGKKFMNTVLFLLVAVAAATLTAYVGKGSGNVLFYNFAFMLSVFLPDCTEWIT